VGTTVLVVAHELDLHAKAVCSTLRSEFGVDSVTLDTADLPSVASAYRQQRGNSSRVVGAAHLDDITSIWWRRPKRCNIPSSLDLSHDEFRQAEADEFVQGLLWSSGAAWVNDPGAQHVASRKIVQLEAARKVGLPVPETLITNDPEAARTFLSDTPGPVICKRTGTGSNQFSETRIVTATDLPRLDAIRLAPTTFQEFVEPDCDLRVVWISGQAWTVRIDSRAGAGRVDSRMDNTVDFQPWELPASTSRGLDALMRKLGLVFGVVDLRISAQDGQVYFLEVNPQGQFVYLEVKTGLPIVHSLAASLAGL
jgi:hypothetical protein